MGSYVCFFFRRFGCFCGGLGWFWVVWGVLGVIRWTVCFVLRRSPFCPSAVVVVFHSPSDVAHGPPQRNVSIASAFYRPSVLLWRLFCLLHAWKRGTLAGSGLFQCPWKSLIYIYSTLIKKKENNQTEIIEEKLTIKQSSEYVFCVLYLNLIYHKLAAYIQYVSQLTSLTNYEKLVVISFRVSWNYWVISPTWTDEWCTGHWRCIHGTNTQLLMPLYRLLYNRRKRMSTPKVGGETWWCLWRHFLWRMLGYRYLHCMRCEEKL